MTNSEISTTKNIKLKEEDKMMKLDLYESRLFGRICYGFGRDEDGYGYLRKSIQGGKQFRKNNSICEIVSISERLDTLRTTIL